MRLSELRAWSILAQSDSAQQLYGFIQEASSDDIATLVAALRSGRVTLSSGIVDLEYHLHGPRESSERCRSLFKAWSQVANSTELSLAIAIEACSLSAERASLLPRAELVWTGPEGGHPTARRTLQVMNEMLRRPFESVLITGYSLFLRGDLARDFIDRLAELSSAGIQVTFVVDRRYMGWGQHGVEGHSIREIMQIWPGGKRRPTIYSWRDEVDESSKLHAKLLLVDNRDLLVTSANLSGGGLETNLELGVRIQGEVARNCGEHFRSLISAGFFISEEWNT